MDSILDMHANECCLVRKPYISSDEVTSLAAAGVDIRFASGPVSMDSLLAVMPPPPSGVVILWEKSGVFKLNPSWEPPGSASDSDGGGKGEEPVMYLPNGDDLPKPPKVQTLFTTNKSPAFFAAILGSAYRMINYHFIQSPPRFEGLEATKERNDFNGRFDEDAAHVDSPAETKQAEWMFNPGIEIDSEQDGLPLLTRFHEARNLFDFMTMQVGLGIDMKLLDLTKDADPGQSIYTETSSIGEALQLYAYHRSEEFFFEGDFDVTPLWLLTSVVKKLHIDKLERPMQMIVGLEVPRPSVELGYLHASTQGVYLDGSEGLPDELDSADDELIQKLSANIKITHSRYPTTQEIRKNGQGYVIEEKPLFNYDSLLYKVAVSPASIDPPGLRCFVLSFYHPAFNSPSTPPQNKMTNQEREGVRNHAERGALCQHGPCEQQ
jgi:hypothetical protein